VEKIIGLMVNGQALGSEDIKLSHRLLQQVQLEGYPPSCFLRKVACTRVQHYAKAAPVAPIEVLRIEVQLTL